VSEDTDWNGQRAAAAGRGFMRCLLDVRRFWRRIRGLCLARLQCLISSVVCRDSCIVTCSVGHWWWWSRWPARSSGGSSSCLNCRMFNRFYIFCKFCISTNNLLSSVEEYCLEPSSPYEHYVYGQICLDLRRLD
jgi:hypothetical protein